MQEQHTQQDTQRGFTLLVAVLVVGIVLAIGLSILNVTLKEFILSGTARESVIALNAADAGMECGLYWDRSSQGNRFDVGTSSSYITCMGQTLPTVGNAASGDVQNFEFKWGTPTVCAKIAITKYYNSSGDVDMGGGVMCPIGVECTRTVSRGYNKACSQITSPRTVERGLRARVDISYSEGYYEGYYEGSYGYSEGYYEGYYEGSYGYSQGYYEGYYEGSYGYSQGYYQGYYQATYYSQGYYEGYYEGQYEFQEG